MKKRFLRLFFLTSAVLTLLTACEYDFIVPAPRALPPPAGDTISFSQDIIPFFNKSCNASCHKTGATAPDLSPANAYTALKTGNFVVAGEPENSDLYISCKSNGSMAIYTNAAQLDLIYRWIYAGAKND